MEILPSDSCFFKSPSAALRVFSFSCKASSSFCAAPAFCPRRVTFVGSSFSRRLISLSCDPVSRIVPLTPFKADDSGPVSPPISTVIPFTLSAKTNHHLSKSACDASLGYLYSSFFCSVNISSTIPTVSRSRSDMLKPSSTQRSKKSGVFTSRSVGRSFFLGHWWSACSAPKAQGFPAKFL